MLDEYFIPHFRHLDSHIWRKNQFWTEQCDLALKRQYKSLQ